MKNFFFKRLFELSVLAAVVILSVIFFSSCGPSKEEIEYYENNFTQQECDSIWHKNGNTSECPYHSKYKREESEQPTTKEEVYFSAAEYNLPPGEVYNFTMDNESAREAFDNGRPTVYIQIKVAGGQIRSFACDERTWYNLTPGNILR